MSSMQRTRPTNGQKLDISVLSVLFVSWSLTHQWRHFSKTLGVDPTGERSYPRWNHPPPQEIGYLYRFVCSRQQAYIYHTLERQCEGILKATKQVNGKGQNSTPRHAKTLLLIFPKIGVGDNVVDLTRHAKFYRAPFRGFCSPYR